MKIQNKTTSTGGTGSFITYSVKIGFKTDHFSEIRIFSRSREKQDDIRNQLKATNLNFILRDVRDYRVHQDVPCVEVDYVFRTAALKQIFCLVNFSRWKL
jgi:UDP-glucose 4-epimerase